MSSQDPIDQLYKVMRERLGANASLEEVRVHLGILGQSFPLDSTSIDSLLARFETDMKGVGASLPPPIPSGFGTLASSLETWVAPNLESPPVDPPQLIIDWGEWPRVGRQVRPELSLICPGQMQTPELHVIIDPQLDHDAHDPARKLRGDSDSNWICHLPFRMTTAGIDCRPGQYLIDLRLAYRDATLGAPRFYRCSIRLSVPDSNSDVGGVLEIDGDGQSIVNLQGYDLRQFSKVVLKGGASSVVNLQNAPGNPAAPLPLPSNSQQPAPIRTYHWKIDAEKQSRLPKIVPTEGRPALLKFAMLRFGDGRRVHLYPQEQLSFGRSRDNDVVLRCFPRSEDNDKLSRGISRTHFHAKLVDEGLEFVDESSAGIMVDERAISSHESWLLDRRHQDTCHLDLNLAGTLGLRFGLIVTMVCSNPQVDADELMFWDEVYAELAHTRSSHLSRKAARQGIDAIRFDRRENLEHEEEYVMLLREATIGGRSLRTTIEVAGMAPMPQARILYMGRSFWLERLPGSRPILVGRYALDARQLIALHPGDEIHFDGKHAVFENSAQLYLDGD